MNEDATTRFILETYHDVHTDTTTPDTFFFYGSERMFPFATLVTHDDPHDNVSNLDRPSVFRLSIGVSKQTFLQLFGAQVRSFKDDELDTSAYDYSALDQLLPHPIYGRMYWVCILKPSAATFQSVVQPLLAEAYNHEVDKQAKKSSRGTSPT